MRCPLCQNETKESFDVSRFPAERLWRCGVCDLVFKDPRERIGPIEEKKRYDSHKNGDEGHRAFLQATVDRVVERVAAGAKGLDWGSGPVAVLAEMLRAEGFTMSTYDPFFGPLEKPRDVFDFITMTEVIEHLAEPGRELTDLHRCLKPEGIFVVQTDLHEAPRDADPVPFFDSWYYRRDPTHVSFFSRATFRWLGHSDLWSLVEENKRVVVLQARG